MPVLLFKGVEEVEELRFELLATCKMDAIEIDNIELEGVFDDDGKVDDAIKDCFSR